MKNGADAQRLSALECGLASAWRTQHRTVRRAERAKCGPGGGRTHACPASCAPCFRPRAAAQLSRDELPAEAGQEAKRCDAGAVRVKFGQYVQGGPPRATTTWARSRRAASCPAAGALCEQARASRLCACAPGGASADGVTHVSHWPLGCGWRSRSMPTQASVEC